MKPKNSAVGIAAFLGIWAISPASSAPAFVNGLAIPATTLDATAIPGANQGRLGFFSDLFYDPVRSQWWGISDRGPGGGLLDYETRVQRFALSVDPATGAISNFQVAQTVKFTDALGNAFNGRAPSPAGVLGNAFDPEGIVVHPASGNLIVSDEYGPSIYEFDRNGRLLRTFATPANLIPRNAATGVANFSDDAGNTAGKRGNRGFEGLAITPDGQYVFATLQSPMLEEGGASGNGRFLRIVKFSVATGQAVAQYAYLMDRSGQGEGVSSLVAVNDHEFLILERNNRGVGVGAELAVADKNVYRIDVSAATDVTSIALPASGTALPAGVVAVGKSAKIVDIDADTLAAFGGKSPEKWEGLAIGPELATGGHLLLAGTDNDFSVTQTGAGAQFDVWFPFAAADPYAASIQCPLDSTTNCFFTTGGGPAALTSAYSLLPGVLHAYSASAADLPGFVAAAAIAEPDAMLLVGGGLAAALACRRRRAPRHATV